MIRVNESMVGTRLSPDGGLDGLAIAGSHISKKKMEETMKQVCPG